MPNNDPRVDQYIQKAQAFARPILAELRTRIHASVPGLEENIKWNSPFFLLDGRIFASIAGFKAHTKLNLWKADFTSAMPTASDFRTLEDLPSPVAFAKMLKASAATFGDSTVKSARVAEESAGKSPARKKAPARKKTTARKKTIARR